VSDDVTSNDMTVEHLRAMPQDQALLWLAEHDISELIRDGGTVVAAQPVSTEPMHVLVSITIRVPVSDRDWLDGKGAGRTDGRSGVLRDLISRARREEAA